MLSMLDNPPAVISKEIKPFISRAHELATVNPAVAYFCKLYAAQSILDKKLHKDDKLVEGYVVELLNDIEETKSNSSPELQELMNDEQKGLQFVKEFAFEVLDNLKTQIEDKKTTRATALGLIASVNFLQLLKLWDDDESSQLGNEITRMTKYAKFHAARILKSLKNGEDPNDYEEVKEEAPEKANAEQGEAEDVEERIKQLELDLNKEKESGALKEEGDEPEDGPTELKSEQAAEPTAEPTAEPKSEPEPNEETPKSSPKATSPKSITPKTVSPIGSPPLPITSYKATVLPLPPKDLNKVQPATDKKTRSAPKKQEAPHEPLSKSEISHIMEETQQFSLAQKHAKFAISALNYDDKDTAIKELQVALALLQ